METETEAQLVSEYDPDIPTFPGETCQSPTLPWATDAERVVFSAQSAVPTGAEVEDYQTMLRTIANKDFEIKYFKNQLGIHKLDTERLTNAFEAVIQSQEEELAERERLLIHYEKLVYEILPTEHKGKIISDYSKLKDKYSERLEYMTKKDFASQRNLLFTLVERRSRRGMIQTIREKNPEYSFK